MRLNVTKVENGYLIQSDEYGAACVPKTYVATTAEKAGELVTKLAIQYELVKDPEYGKTTKD